jgi:hypothetical protein
MKTKTFAVGDRVKVYTGGMPEFKGTIHSFDAWSFWVIKDGFVSPDMGSPFHPRQLVKLKKVKSVRVTREKVINALSSVHYFENRELEIILNKLGL